MHVTVHEQTSVLSFVFSSSVFCSQIFTLKLNSRPKIGLTYANSIVKCFLELLSKEIYVLN